MKKVDFAVEKVNFPVKKVNFALKKVDFIVEKVDLIAAKVSFPRIEENFNSIIISKLYADTPILPPSTYILLSKFKI